LADAKKLHLLPSVTGYTGILDKPALLNWKATQVAIAAFNTPPQPDETVEYFCERVIGASKAPVAAAADLGSKVHDALEKLLTEGPFGVPDDMWDYVGPVVDWKKKNKIVYTDIEVVLVNTDYGYAGRCDALGTDEGGNRLVIDYKTRKTKPKQKVGPYDTQGMQLAAYAVAKWGEDQLHTVHGYNVYISTTEVGRVEPYKHDSLVPHWEAFKAACILWRHVKGYDPRQPAFSTLKEAA
jgi:CRISPR/Cas system-associated exonuclease Cas4 (RecB family)